MRPSGPFALIRSVGFCIPRHRKDGLPKYDSQIVAVTALRSYAAHKKDFPNEDDLGDPASILVSMGVDIAIGANVNRDGDASRYSLRDGLRVLAVIASLQTGFGAYSPDQAGSTDEPAFGIHETRWEAEAEAVIQTYTTSSNDEE